MSRFSRSISLFALLTAIGASSAAAQSLANDNFRWYIGGQAGAFIYRTPSQTRGAIPMVGGHMLIKAKRGGLFVAVDEAFKKNQVSNYIDANGATVNVTFTDVRRYTFGLMAFPVRGAATPYFGVGGGIMNVVSPKSGGVDDALAAEMGSTGFATFIAGLQFRVGGVSAFGQYQLQTAPGYKTVAVPDGEDGTIYLGEGRLINGTVHSISGGIRISLGSSREEI